MTGRVVARFLARRLLQAVPVLFGIATLNFVILQLAPGDVVDVLAGEAGAATPEYMAQLRHAFGLDQPLYIQFARYIWHLATLNLGFSFRLNLPVQTLIAQRLPDTVLLMATALAFATLVGSALGILAARRPHGVVDRVVSLVVLVSYAVPAFWLGLMSIVIFAVWLRWLPTGGMYTIASGLAGWAFVLDVGRHLILPALTLSSFYLAIYTRLVRSAMLELSGADFIRTARAKGAGEWRVTLVHAFRNALLPLVTMLGFQIASVLSGAVLVESVFGWPGLGRLAYDAILARDYNLLLGLLFVSSALVTVTNILVDLLHVLLDPRAGTLGEPAA